LISPIHLRTSGPQEGESQQHSVLVTFHWGRRTHGKSLLHPQPEGWNTSPQPMKIDFLPNFLKQDKSPPEAVFKNHSKSQEKRKMKNQIVLDFKLEVLRSEHTIWNILVHIFFITLDLCFSP
jgi:hypothetical protein